MGFPFGLLAMVDCGPQEGMWGGEEKEREREREKEKEKEKELFMSNTARMSILDFATGRFVCCCL